MKNFIQRIFLKSVLILVLSFFGYSSSKAQCPMCKAAVESSMKDKKNTKGRGLNNGILYLLAMPYLIAGATGAGFYYRYKKNKKQKSI